MSTATIIIKDHGDEIQVEGHLDPPTAIDLPPTPAVIIGSYLAGNMPQICKDAVAWYQAMVTAPPAEEPVIAAPKLIVPGAKQ